MENGAKKEQITFLYRIPSHTGIGDGFTWKESSPFYAVVNVLSNRKRFDNNTDTNISMAEFILDYGPVVFSDTRIKYNGNEYAIESPPRDPNQRRRKIIIMGRLVDLDGYEG